MAGETSGTTADPHRRMPNPAREREVLGHLALGRTNREIARELYVSERTAKFHVKNIIEKLGVEDRKQAAERASGFGLVGENHTPLAEHEPGAQGP